MKMAKANATTKEMAMCLRITEEECVEYLRVLKFIEEDEKHSTTKRTVWKMTEAGKTVGRVTMGLRGPINHWDVYAYLAVSNLKGKKEKTHAFCDNCGMSLGLQTNFTFLSGDWKCTRCYDYKAEKLNHQ